MQQLISDVADGKIDMVLVYKLDRLSRSQKDTLFLIEDVFIKINVKNTKLLSLKNLWQFITNA